MNDTTAVATKTAAKEPAAVEAVTMTDGRVVDFPGKKRMQKDSFIAADGAVSVRLDFRNGETRVINLRPDMLAKYAAHGAEQKLGDEIAGLKSADGGEADIDDVVLTIDELIARLDAGDWTTKRDTSGMSGTSVLLRAIVAVTGKPVDSIKAYLAGKTQAQKMALRDSDKFAAAVAKIEAERKTKAKAVDISADLAELEQIS